MKGLAGSSCSCLLVPKTYQANVAVKMILTGQIQDTGVHIPVKPEIYNPVLDELATMKIRCEERTES